MARWRPRRTMRLHSRWHDSPGAPAVAWKRPVQQGLPHHLNDYWSLLHRHCADHLSHLRLGRLLHRLAHHDPGVQESALAELEIATQLIRVGLRVTFLPESQARTADLECGLGSERFFVEVTAMVGSAERRRLPVRGIMRDEEPEEETDCGVILTHRVLARIRQKAKQLADYCDAVVLSISIPRADLLGGRQGRREQIRMDLKALAGSITVDLMKLRHLSAVLISLWDVEPLPSRSALRLANVDLVERARHQRTHPRVRLLIQNPTAAAPLSERQADVFRLIL
ncbi:MAG TPA: hypothetical protein VFU48_13445 [Nitrospira sp.]|nr:hypothetical protein [Nitrospira sp.]